MRLQHLLQRDVGLLYISKLVPVNCMSEQIHLVRSKLFVFHPPQSIFLSRLVGQ
uniref:Uncharacterized protein n=1 Tax=Arundo donax TaxID=35708 RepID=A0A0A9EDT4_ARUDO